jgi:hypothetical protein
MLYTIVKNPLESTTFYIFSLRTMNKSEEKLLRNLRRSDALTPLGTQLMDNLLRFLCDPCCIKGNRGFQSETPEIELGRQVPVIQPTCTYQLYIFLN